MLIVFSTLSLLVCCKERHLARNKLSVVCWWWWSLCTS